MTTEFSLVHTMSEFPKEDIALSDAQGVALSYGQLLSEISTATEVFRSFKTAGIATLMDNSPAHVVVLIAAMHSEAWVVPLPPFFTRSQRQNALVGSGCSKILSDVDLPHLTKLTAFEIAGVRLFLFDTEIQCSNEVLPGTSLITYTSGSTGTPKGVCLSTDNILRASFSVSSALDNLSIKRHLSILPLSVLLEQTAGVFAALSSGVECIIPELQTTGLAGNVFPDFDALHSIIRSSGANSCILVPELLKGLVRCSAKNTLPLEELIFLAVGGAKVSPELLDEARYLGLPVYEGYGLSEAGSVVTLNLPKSCKSGSVGRVLTHQNLIVSEEGEIYLKEPSFLGYCGSHQSPEAPFPTGDLGSLDCDGYLSVTGRKKNVLITSMGRNVSPEWIESSLTRAQSVHQAYVYGDAQRSLEVLLVSEHSDDVIQDTINQLNSTLPDYAQLASWRRVCAFTSDEGTLTGNGKLRRNAISERYFSDVKQA